MDFFASHTYDFLILIGCAICPRITMLFLGGGFGLLFTTAWHWIGWFLCPHLTVAILATIYYSETNPGLCLISWICALCGTGGEVETVRRTK